MSRFLVLLAVLASCFAVATPAVAQQHADRRSTLSSFAMESTVVQPAPSGSIKIVPCRVSEGQESCLAWISWTTANTLGNVGACVKGPDPVCLALGPGGGGDDWVPVVATREPVTYCLITLDPKILIGYPLTLACTTVQAGEIE